MKEYIYPVEDYLNDKSKIFVGYIRKQTELIRCKDCKFYERKYCTAWCEEEFGVAVETEANGYCYLAERKEK